MNLFTRILSICPLLGVLLLLQALPSFAQSGAPYKLVGTIQGKSGFTGAVIDDNSGMQNFYRMREPLPDGSQIVKIGSDKVSIKRSDGSAYELYLPQNSGKSTPAVAARPAVPAQPQQPSPTPIPSQPAAAPEQQPRHLGERRQAQPGIEAGREDGGAARRKTKRGRRPAKRGAEEE